MPVWQPDNVGADAGALQMLGELTGSVLSSLVVVLVEDDVDGTARLLSKLSPGVSTFFRQRQRARAVFP